jgi:hypothetical protein
VKVGCRVDDETRSSWPPPGWASRASRNIPHGRPRAATERRRADRRRRPADAVVDGAATERRGSGPKQPYSDDTVQMAGIVGMLLLALAGLLVYLGTGGDWTRFDDSIECGDSLQSVLMYCGLAMLVGGVVVVVVGLGRAVKSQSWACAWVSFAGVCLFICGVSCWFLAVQVSYAASCD